MAGMNVDNDAIWDAENGVWVGERALSQDDIKIPKPLYIFGYGSLMFRPQDSFANCEKFDGLVYGWKRLWAQRSCDHRGEPHMPGLVVTVLSDEELEELKLRQVGDAPSVVHGVAYRIAPEQEQKVLDELDFREKGGYTRAVVDVHLTGGGEGTIQALLYTANADNPNFHQLSTTEEAAHIVAWSEGPSGKNKEYLFEVDSYLKRVQATCEETFTLAEMVQHVLREGLDRRHEVDERHQRRPMYHRLELLTWGSNQHGQLGSMAQEEAEWATPRQTYIDMDVAATKAWRDGDRRIRQVAAGGGHSAVLTEDDRLYLWGWNEHGQVAGSYGGEAAAAERATHEVHVLPRRVAMVALGHAHSLFIEQGTGKVYGLGVNAHGETTGCCTGGRKGGEDCRDIGGASLQVANVPLRFSWVAAGVRHSAGVTLETGELVTWGSRKYGEGLPLSKPCWRPADGAHVLKASCGWKHTLILDEQNRLWSMGANTNGQLGRPSSSTDDDDDDDGLYPRLVDWRVPDVAIKSITCGWSHNLVLLENGEVWGWGKNSFGQLGLPSGAGGGGGGGERISSPVQVTCEAWKVKHVACGPESSLLVLEDDSVWVSGWNEHGNLGVGDQEDRGTWTRVRDLPPCPLLVACGGAHVVALPKSC